ncbi:MAG TPA: efflux RND transporter periplasmic adaptor subunit [Roseiarcus sp.]|nr:efflux RND transporter periplasmic adaptor subunit [Roseiarcus sp.]
MTHSVPSPIKLVAHRPKLPGALLAALWGHRWFVLTVLALGALGAGQGLRVLFGPAVVAERVARGDVVETVVATGNVLTPYRANIGAQITGTVTEVLVEEGERVVKGQSLIALDDTELKAARVQAEGALAEAEARMRQLKDFTLPTARENLAQAQANLIDAQKAFDRADALLKSGSGTQATLDDARKALDVARAQVNAANLAVYTASPGGSDYVMAETQLRQAKANLDTAKARLGYATIVAPRDGVLITRNVERGYVVQPGAALLVLAPAGQTQLELQIDERNLGKLALGQKALASADAYPDQRFDAVVSYINPGVDINRATVEVKLDVPNPPPYLVQDMTVSVDVDVASKQKTLVLPAQDVHDELSSAPWVMSVRDGRAYKAPVRLGLHGLNAVEIADGLAEGAWALPVGSGVVTGQRVRPFTP